MVIGIPGQMIQIIDDIRATVGRAVTFTVLDSATDCPACDIDPVTDTSTDSFCPTCSGLGYIYEYEDVIVSGHVIWKTADDLNPYVAGQIFEGDCTVQVKYTDYNLDIIDRTESIEVDGRTLKLDKVIPRGVPQPNRIILLLQEEDKDNE